MFDHLAAEGPPTLALPFSYRLLDNAFQAMDTVLSMMHNRSEICTFSKLKAAVQNMTRKNFKAVGQIKTVAPDAYLLRQEKNISAYGKKVSGYQLTIEPNNISTKNSNADSENRLTKEGKPVFQASYLVKRKNEFKNKLLDLVKKQNKLFLSRLTPPIVVPDDKITRWHPKFQLDKLPEVSVSPLPESPEMYVYHTAKDVLEKQRGKLTPRVEEALSRVAADNIKLNTSHNSSQNSSPSSSPTVSQASPSRSSSKGIQAFLLAKIRAKEAQKMQEFLTRDPVEGSKITMMSHLPQIMRILRTFFIVKKKQAIPLELVYKKLQESYKSGISICDVELHINLRKKLAPDLISLVEIKRGNFVKLDKNIDLQVVTSRILNQVKARQ